jgi:hypothetical protein
MRIIGHMRLPAFRLLFSFVIAGLDPAIHADEKLDGSADKLSEPHVGMDHRVKPAGDEVFCLWQNSGAGRVARTVLLSTACGEERDGDHRVIV